MLARTAETAATRAVLGIDAAWTTTQPSGVALAVQAGESWRLVTAQPSYDCFVAAAHGGFAPKRPTGGLPHAKRLLEACTRLHAGGVDLVAIDMPLSRKPISARRACDNLVSRIYGGRHCGTHSPSAARPGLISDNLRRDFEHAGYPLLVSIPVRRGVAEVYPHPALLALTGAEKRLPYKAGKTLTYWPGVPRAERKRRLYDEWRRIVSALDREMPGVADVLCDPDDVASGYALKAYEDRLDAVICAWIGTRILHGCADAFGDEDAAIWIPAAEAP